MTRVDALVEALRERARNGDGVISLGRTFVELTSERFEPMIFIATFHKAFGVPIRTLHETVSWVGFGYDDVGDDEFDAQLRPYIDAWREGRR